MEDNGLEPSVYRTAKTLADSSLPNNGGAYMVQTDTLGRRTNSAVGVADQLRIKTPRDYRRKL